MVILEFNIHSELDNKTLNKTETLPTKEAALARAQGYQNTYHGNFTFIRIRDKQTDQTLVDQRQFNNIEPPIT